MTTDGQPIKKLITALSGVLDGSHYDVTGNKDSEITNGNKTYQFDRVQDNHSLTGQINGADVTITLVYKQSTDNNYQQPTLDTPSKQDKKYTRKIRFKNTRGEVLKTIDVDQVFTSGNHYDANQYRQATITVNGKTYELVPTESTNISGDFTDHNEVSTFIYRLHSVPHQVLIPQRIRLQIKISRTRLVQTGKPETGTLTGTPTTTNKVVEPSS